MRHLYTRSPDIPGPLKNLLTTRSLQKTSIRIQHAESTERVARKNLKLAPRYSESDPTRTNSVEGYTNRKKKNSRLSASDIPSAKWRRHYSQTDPTRTHKVPRGLHLQTQNRHRVTTRLKKSKFRPHLDIRIFIQNAIFPYFVMQILHLPRKNESRHTKSCHCHAKRCQHSGSISTAVSQNEHFELFTTDLKSTKYWACHEKMTFFHHLQFLSNPYNNFAHLSKDSCFWHFPISENQHGAQARTHLRNGPCKDPVLRRQNANVQPRGNLARKGLPKKPNASAHTTNLHQMLFSYRKNPVVSPHCLGKNIMG